MSKLLCGYQKCARSEVKGSNLAATGHDLISAGKNHTSGEGSLSHDQKCSNSCGYKPHFIFIFIPKPLMIIILILFAVL